MLCVAKTFCDMRLGIDIKVNEMCMLFLYKRKNILYDQKVCLSV